MKKEQFLDICRSKANKPLTQEDEQFLGAIGEGIEKAMGMETVERSKAIEQSLTKLVGSFDEGETVASIIRNLATKVENIEENAKRGLTNTEKHNLRKMLIDKQDEIKAARSSKQDWAIEFRAKRGASAMMTSANVLTGASAINNINVFDDLDILVIQYPKNFILDAITSRQVQKVPAVVRWKEQNTESTDALGAVSEGGEKKLTDKTFVWKTADRVKYAGRIEFTEELAIDFEQLLIQIIDMFEMQVIRKWNAGVQTAIVNYCQDYTTTELDHTFVSPSTSAVIKAGKLWVENRLYSPDIVMIRPGDAALAGIQQNKDGDIVYVPDAIAFSGLTPFISTNVPEGKIIVGTSSTIKEQHGNFIIRRGVYNEQFINNEETIVGEVFSVLQLPTVSNNSWVILDIATVKNALLKVNA